MATFDVLVRKLDRIEPHPNADRLDLAVVGDYRCVVGKGQFRAGDLVAYLPEASILPTRLIEDLGLVGKLAGPQANRVHPVRLRGALSQGVVISAREGWVLCQSVMKELGVSKFIPEIPAEMLGSAYALEEHERLSFDIENIKAYPGLFHAGESVVFTEKLHGVFMAIGAVPPGLARPGCGHRDGLSFVSSKGLLADRMAFKLGEENAANPYVAAADRLGLHAVVQKMASNWGTSVWILGEMFGMGIQDLAYGQLAGKPSFRIFAIVLGLEHGDPVYLDDVKLEALITHFHLERVPVLYRGQFSAEAVAMYTSGRETVSGQRKHMREGIVITPCTERSTSEIGRLVLKSVSEEYLLRKGGTEYA